MLAQSRNALALPAAAAYPMAPRRARSCRDARSAEISLTRSNDTSASMTSKSAELLRESAMNSLNLNRLMSLKSCANLDRLDDQRMHRRIRSYLKQPGTFISSYLSSLILTPYWPLRLLNVGNPFKIFGCGWHHDMLRHHPELVLLCIFLHSLSTSTCLLKTTYSDVVWVRGGCVTRASATFPNDIRSVSYIP